MWNNFRITKKSEKKNRLDICQYDSENEEQEISSYLKNKYKNENVLEFWDLNSTSFPILSNLAKMILAATATSVPSETLFSASGYQIWDRRNRRVLLKMPKWFYFYMKFLIRNIIFIRNYEILR